MNNPAQKLHLEGFFLLLHRSSSTSAGHQGAIHMLRFPSRISLLSVFGLSRVAHHNGRLLPLEASNDRRVDVNVESSQSPRTTHSTVNFSYAVLRCHVCLHVYPNLPCDVTEVGKDKIKITDFFFTIIMRVCRLKNP